MIKSTSLHLCLLFLSTQPFSTLSFIVNVETNKLSARRTGITSMMMTAANEEQTSSSISRRKAFTSTVTKMGAFCGMSVAFSPFPSMAAVAEETPKITTRMGGLLDRYQDSKGWTILSPSGWNKFDGEVGAYDTKWQDVVDPMENIKVSSNPVTSNTTSIVVLGDVQVLGNNLATKRKATLIKAEERLTEGIVFYSFDFKLSDNTHQLLLLCVNKGKIWSLDANASEKRWGKREELYNNVLGSFMPKLT